MKHAEANIQREVVKWISLQYPHVLFFSVPNEGKRKASTGRILNEMGRLSGVADLFVCYPVPGYHGLFLELKAASGKQTQAQKWFAYRATSVNYQYEVARSFDEARAAIETYFNTK